MTEDRRLAAWAVLPLAVGAAVVFGPDTYESLTAPSGETIANEAVKGLSAVRQGTLPSGTYVQVGIEAVQGTGSGPNGEQRKGPEYRLRGVLISVSPETGDNFNGYWHRTGREPSTALLAFSEPRERADGKWATGFVGGSFLHSQAPGTEMSVSVHEGLHGDPGVWSAPFKALMFAPLKMERGAGLDR